VFAGRYPPPSERTLDPLLVSGCVVVGSDFFRLLIASLRKIVGGNYRSYEKLMDRGRRHALVKLKADAQARGAAMVFNVRYTASGVANTRAREAPQIQVIAYGTAFVHAAGSVAQSRVAHRPSTHIHDHDGQTDLWRHPVAKWWVIGWFAGVAYCFAELFTDSVWTHAWRYVDGAPWAVYGAVAALGTAALMALARKHRLGWGESLILSMLTVPMLAAAFYFLGLRLNALTAPDTVAVRYELQADLRRRLARHGQLARRIAQHGDAVLRDRQVDGGRKLLPDGRCRQRGRGARIARVALQHRHAARVRRLHLGPRQVARHSAADGAAADDHHVCCHGRHCAMRAHRCRQVLLF